MATSKEFKNVAVPVEDHELLREIAEVEQRSMARQLAVLIREKWDKLDENGAFDD